MTPGWLEDPWNEFAARLEQDRLPHALLVTGPAGIGKRQLAARMVDGLLCESGRAEACGECRSCRLLPGGAHPDRFTVEPEEGKREITVDAIRNLNGGLVLTTSISQRKVASVIPAEAMNRNAANALLKTLEEPPGDTVIVLVADDASRLPATIRSRCQLLPVRPPAHAQAVEWLIEASGIDAERAALALEATAGRPLLAERLIAEGGDEAYQSLRTNLSALIGKPSRAGALAVALKDEDRDRLWTWLALAAARALEHVLDVDGAAWPSTEYSLPADRLSELQQRADRNRAFLASSVRQDLLLREWLLEWARLPATEPIR